MHATPALKPSPRLTEARLPSPASLGAVVLLAALASASGCSSSSDAGQPSGDAAADAIDGCSVPSDEPGATCLRTVSGKVTDVDGAPVVGKTISVCGIACYYAETDANGAFVAKIGANLVTGSYAVLAHGRPEYASLYSKLPTTGGEHLTIATMKLPKYTAGSTELPADGAAASSITAGDLTLDVPTGTKFNLDVEDVGTPTGRQLRLGAAKVDDLPTFAADTGALALYALSPFGATSVLAGSSGPGGAKASKLGVRIQNKIGLPAGQKVEFFVLGVNLLSKPPSAGTAMTVAKGTVSADGATIATDAGEGISTLSWLGVKKAP